MRPIDSFRATGNQVAWLEAVTAFIEKWNIDKRCEHKIVEQHWFVRGKLLKYFTRGNLPWHADFNPIMMSYLRNKKDSTQAPNVPWPNDNELPTYKQFLMWELKGYMDENMSWADHQTLVARREPPTDSELQRRQWQGARRGGQERTTLISAEEAQRLLLLHELSSPLPAIQLREVPWAALLVLSRQMQ